MAFTTLRGYFHSLCGRTTNNDFEMTQDGGVERIIVVTPGCFGRFRGVWNSFDRVTKAGFVALSFLLAFVVAGTIGAVCIDDIGFSKTPTVTSTTVSTSTVSQDPCVKNIQGLKLNIVEIPKKVDIVDVSDKSEEEKLKYNCLYDVTNLFETSKDAENYGCVYNDTALLVSRNATEIFSQNNNITLMYFSNSEKCNACIVRGQEAMVKEANNCTVSSSLDESLKKSFKECIGSKLSKTRRRREPAPTRRMIKV